MAKKKNEKEIVRTIRFNSEEFSPGMEDELSEAIANHADDDEDFDEAEELKRLTRMGALVGFADVSDEELEETDADRHATRKSGNAAMLVERRPFARSPRRQPTLEEAGNEPDVNQVEAQLGGKGKAKGPTKAERQKAAEKAKALRDEAALQQESEQTPDPDVGAEGAGADKE